MVYEDGSYYNSVRNQYNKYGKCMGTHAQSEHEAIFVIQELSELQPGANIPQVKFVMINYDTGEYSVMTFDGFSSVTQGFSYYLQLGVFKKLDSNGELENFYIYGEAEGLDDGP